MAINLSTLRTPGVYIDEIKKFPPSIAAVETAIPAFIGYTQKALKRGENLTLKPTRISSMLEYEEFFGSTQQEQNLEVRLQQSPTGRLQFVADFDWSDGKGPSKHLLYYAMQQFYANGGGPCYIVSVGTFLEFGTTISVPTPFETALDELEKFDEPTLIVIPEGQSMDHGTYFQVISKAINQCVELGDRFVIMDVQHSGRDLQTAGEIKEVADEFRDLLQGGGDTLKYGAAYFPNIRSTFNYDYDPALSNIKLFNQTGADIPLSALTNSQKSNVILALNTLDIYLPPSASVAGVYARVDNARGVWKAPANESLRAVSDISCQITDRIQAFLNVDDNAGKSINAIRTFTGKGIIVWGARTLNGNDNEWRYVPVRRFFNMVEESAKKATFQFVFEPNDKNSWTRVKSMIGNFLFLQWRSGALMGTTAEQAYFVKVGLNETMSELDIWEGRMIVEIGMAVVRPAEFIILRFSHKMLES